MLSIQDVLRYETVLVQRHSMMAAFTVILFGVALVVRKLRRRTKSASPLASGTQGRGCAGAPMCSVRSLRGDKDGNEPDRDESEPMRLPAQSSSAIFASSTRAIRAVCCATCGCTSQPRRRRSGRGCSRAGALRPNVMHSRQRWRRLDRRGAGRRAPRSRAPRWRATAPPTRLRCLAPLPSCIRWPAAAAAPHCPRCRHCCHHSLSPRVSPLLPPLLGGRV